jgi:hypothetical protein
MTEPGTNIRMNGPKWQLLRNIRKGCGATHTGTSECAFMGTAPDRSNHLPIPCFLIAVVLATAFLPACAETDASTDMPCRIRPTRGNEVAVIGESFIAMTHGLTAEIEALAMPTAP